MQPKAGTSELHKLLLKQGRQYSIAKGHIVQSSDYRHVINLVKSGFVKRYMIASNGSIGVQSIFGPGDVFPLTIIFKTLLDQEIYEGPEVYHYETMTDTELYTIDKTALEAAVEKNQGLYKDLLSEAGKRFNSNIQQLENLALKNSYRRVAHQLLYFARKFGVPGKGGIQLDIQLSHQDLGDILSITRETVTNCMQKLRTKGLIKTDDGILVPSMAKLEAEAYG